MDIWGHFNIIFPRLCGQCQ